MHIHTDLCNKYVYIFIFFLHSLNKHKKYQLWTFGLPHSTDQIQWLNLGKNGCFSVGRLGIRTLEGRGLNH